MVLLNYKTALQPVWRVCDFFFMFAENFGKFMGKKLQIKISSEGKTGRIDIIGSISEWNANNATDFRAKCTELKGGGITGCHVYLMTSGGDCFQAGEIVNILNEVFGSYTAEGGALVASAGTYIAVRASSFVLAQNGQFMIHKPSGWADGNETEMENALKLLKNITKDYYDTYVSKLRKPEAKFKAKWDAGDFWMTAQEALEWGFVSEIKSQPADIDAETAGIIRACGSPFKISVNSNNNQLKMKNLVTLLMAAFALSDITSESSEAEVVAAIQGKFNALNKKISDLEAAAKAQTGNAIKALLDEAQKQGKIVAGGGKTAEQIRAAYEGVGQTGGIEALQTILSGLSAPKSILSQIQGGKGIDGGDPAKNWNWYQTNAPEALEKMEKENPEDFKRLYKAEYGVDPKN